MTYRLIIFCTLLFASFNLLAQDEGPFFNLDFEDNQNPNTIADDWIHWGKYKLSTEKEIVQSGKYAAIIESINTKGSFGSIAYKIPCKYIGKEITLKGYMKTENVADGHAGLLLRLDGKSGPEGFENMQDQAIIGSHDWKEYSITLPFSDNIEQIIVGGIMEGSGKAWFDNFTVLIDGKTIQGMPVIEKPKSKADLDTEFENGSTIELGNITKEEEYRLYTLGKIWGLIKYHHPEVAKGNHNMDYELFRILPSLKADDFELQVNKWITSFGKVTQPIDEIKKEGATMVLANGSWIKENNFLSADSKNYLEKIRTCFKHHEQYYISPTVGVSNPSFDNELPHKNMDFADDGMRILSLFRYWNMVEYFFPYKHIMDEDWDNVLKSFVPKMVNASDELSYKLVTLDLISKIQDTHANIWMRDEVLAKFHGQFGTPIGIQFIEKQWVVTKIYDLLENPNSKIAIGDVITEVNGIAITDIAKEKIKYCPASNLSTQMRDVAKRLLRTNETSIDLTLKNKNGIFTESVNTVLNEGIKYWETDTPSHKLLDGNIGYIYPGSLERDEIYEIMKTLGNTKSLIIDLRCYPSDFLVFKLAGFLLPKRMEFAMFSIPNLENPGTFTFSDPISNGNDNPDYYKGKVLILINEQTQSQAEYTTMALRNAPKATVIGSTTAGADGNISRIILPGGIRTMFSGIGVFYPDGRQTQRVGIVPDIELLPTLEGVRRGKDELLDLAIKMSLE